MLKKIFISILILIILLYPIIDLIKNNISQVNKKIYKMAFNDSNKVLGIKSDKSIRYLKKVH